MQTRVDEGAIDDIVDGALTVAIAHIQNQLDVETGDFAAMYFTGTVDWKTMMDILRRYVHAEIRVNKED